MKLTLMIPIQCGKTTCAYKPGKFCCYAGTRRLGTAWVCRLFPTDDDSYTPLREDAPAGRLLRCDACLASAAKPGEEP